MNEDITSFKLDVYKETAYTYLVIVLCAMFFPGIPILLPIGFLNMWSRYIYNRSLLQNNSSRIPGLGEDFTSFLLLLLPWTLMLCTLIGEWMLVSNENIYPDHLPMQLPVLLGIFV